MRCTLQRSGRNSAARRSFIAGAFALLCACSGGGSGGPLTSAPPLALAPTSGSTQNVALGLRPVRDELPVTRGISGSLTFPAVSRPITISVTVSATAPASGTVVAAARFRKTASDITNGTLTVYEYITIESPLTITLPSLPAISLTFPASTPLAGQSISYGISTLDDRGGLVNFDTHGPGTVEGQTVSFPAIPTPVTFAANHAYTFVVYASPLASAGAVKIFIVNGFDSIVTYDAKGTVTSPTITEGLSSPFGLALASGKLYVTNTGNNTVTTYDTDGTPTKPTITAGLSTPDAVAVDAKGKIYVTNLGNASGGSLTTYTASGTRTTPTIAAGPNGFSGVAVDAAGSIYVVNAEDNALDIYAANGTPKGAIVAGINGPNAVAIDAGGKIYVANFTGNTITTYESNGTRTSPTISVGLTGPQGIALDAAGKIYVLNSNDTVTTYNADGTQSTPTISELNSPSGIAVETIGGASH